MHVSCLTLSFDFVSVVYLCCVLLFWMRFYPASIEKYFQKIMLNTRFTSFFSFFSFRTSNKRKCQVNVKDTRTHQSAVEIDLLHESLIPCGLLCCSQIDKRYFFLFISYSFSVETRARTSFTTVFVESNGTHSSIAQRTQRGKMSFQWALG